MSKRKKRLLVVAAIVFALYFAIPIVDRVWFAFRAPSDFADAQWQGDWHSDQISLVSGRILVKMPDPVPTDQEFDVDALVYYWVWSPYRTGSFVHMRMVGYLASDHSGGGDNAKSPVTVPPHYSFKFKSGGGPSAQIIEYIATSDTHDTIIVGGYRSTGPDDIGRFALSRR